MLVLPISYATLAKNGKIALQSARHVCLLKGPAERLIGNAWTRTANALAGRQVLGGDV